MPKRTFVQTSLLVKCKLNIITKIKSHALTGNALTGCVLMDCTLMGHVLMDCTLMGHALRNCALTAIYQNNNKQLILLHYY